MEVLSSLLAIPDGLATQALAEAFRTYRPPPGEALEELLRNSKVRELIAVYRVAIGNYTDRKLALRRRYLANDDGSFRIRGKLIPMIHWGVGDNTYGGLYMMYSQAEDYKNRLRRELLELGVPMSVLRQIHRGER